MERLRCRPIVHITENRPQRMNTSSVLIGEEGEGRKRKGGEAKRGEELGDRHGRRLSELEPMNCSLSEKNWQSVAQPCSVLRAQQTTTSKLVRQNASGIHQNAPFREYILKNFMWRGQSPLCGGAEPPPQIPTPTGRGKPPPHTHLFRRFRRLDSRAFGARSSPLNFRAKRKSVPPLFETKLRPCYKY